MRSNLCLSVILLLVLISTASCTGGKEPSHVADERVDTTAVNEIPENDLATTQFNKKLSLQGFEFKVSAEQTGTYSRITILASGMQMKEDSMIFEAEGVVGNAEIEDLDSDGYPEVVVYSFSGENNYGHVHGVSVLAGQSLGIVSLPLASANTDWSTGYMGHDEFTLIETNLGRRFPIFKDGQDTGTVRQITYRLSNGENGKVFIQTGISEYNTPTD